MHVPESPQAFPPSEHSVERSEADSYADFVRSAPQDALDALGFAEMSMAGGCALALPRDPSGFWSKALGFGIEGEIDRLTIREIVDFYLLNKVQQASFQIGPSRLPLDWGEICVEFGISAGNTLAKLVCPVDGMSETDLVSRIDATPFEVRVVTAAEATRWSWSLLRGFGMPEDPDLARMFTGCVHAPGWTVFGAFKGNKVVGVGSVRISGEYAHIFGGATLPEARSHGVQTALLAARARVARAAGCNWLVAETGTEVEGQHNPSLHNLRRLGFTTLYERQTWVWSNECSTAAKRSVAEAG